MLNTHHDDQPITHYLGKSIMLSALLIESIDHIMHMHAATGSLSVVHH
jgi:hypothetical protein